MKYLVLLFLLFSCSSNKNQITQNDSESSSTSVQLNVKKLTLDNGLRVLIVENKRLPVFSYYTFYDVGGRHERKGITGASHFLEHLMFKGAKKYGPGEFDKIIENNGGSNNAYTTFDSTVYYEDLPSAALEKVIDLEADRMVNLALEPTGFEKEKQVVLEERKMRYENSPHGKLYQKMMKAVFRKTPYGGSVIGEPEDIKNLDRDAVFEYFKKFYAPNNAVVVIVGDVDSDDTFDLIKKYYGPLKRSEKVAETKKEMDDPEIYKHQGQYRNWYKIHGESPSPIFMMAYKGKKLGDRASYVMDILSSVLGDGASSYLYQRYVKSKSPSLNNIYAANYNLKYNGVFFISGELLKRTNLNRFKDNIHREMRKVCKNAITERNLQKIKNQYLIQFYKGLQTNAGIAQFIGSYENYFGDYSKYKDEVDIYNSITLEELMDTCHSMFKSGEYIFVTIWDKHPKRKG